MRQTLDTYTARYRFGDRWYTVEVEARDWAEAAARVKALAWARLDGRVICTVSLPQPRLRRFVRAVTRMLRPARWTR